MVAHLNDVRFVYTRTCGSGGHADAHIHRGFSYLGTKVLSIAILHVYEDISDSKRTFVLDKKLAYILSILPTSGSLAGVALFFTGQSL